MPSKKEIKGHINSVRETQKITSAMYLIASNKMTKAKKEWHETSPYFSALRNEISRMFMYVDDSSSPFLERPNRREHPEETYGMLVITSDKGLAGSYNKDVIAEAYKLAEAHPNIKTYMVGEFGRQYCLSNKIPFEERDFFIGKHPTLGRARRMSNLLFDEFLQGKLKRIYLVYTDYKNGMKVEARTEQVLPLPAKRFHLHGRDVTKESKYEFLSPVEKVLENIIPSYLTGYIYSALVDSFFSEQSDRMMAMDASNENAQKLLDQLGLDYNHVRQDSITQEITEISAAAKAQEQNGISGR
ncbi:MAG: ATP synthase F1 subunit gamma [Peptoniphilaceae bacterium]|nr:ATP synthase F1 subunit gamma [Peptoniphilaceae bacterium]MDY5765459.1 ATP synthase F1 subunit gamma [Peptoniphilaceae bacterium]